MTSPSKLEIFVGGGPEPAYSVESIGTMLRYTCIDQHGSPTEDISPTEEDWNRFKDTLEDLNVWNWKPSYSTSGIILDGTSWSISAHWDGQEIESKGSNAFPSRFGEFLDSVSSLIDGRHFS